MKHIFLLLKLAVTAGLLWYLFRDRSLDELVGVIERADSTLIVLGVAVLALQPLIGAVRWLVIVRRMGAGISLWQAIGLTYVGVFFNQALPSTVGADALKMWLTRQLGLPLAVAINSVILDRVVMLLGLIIAVAMSAPWIADYLNAPEVTLLGPLLLLCTGGGVLFVTLADRLPLAWHRWRGVQALMRVGLDVRRVLLNARTSSCVLGLALLSYLNMTTSVYLFAIALGEPLGIVPALTLVPPVLLVSALPISIGGWGAREVTMVTALSAVGVTEGGALLVSVMLGLASILVSLPGIPFYVFRRAVKENPERAYKGETAAVAGDSGE